MNKKTIIIIVIVGIIAILFVLMSKGGKSPDINTSKSVSQNIDSTKVKTQAPAKIEATVKTQSPVKEFSMTSFTDMVGGEPKPQFSLKEITVNKGDRVRIKITEVSGMHNFNIDEFGVYAETPLNKETIVEFVADKSGSFVYYCSKPGHRANGHWGTLKVL